MLSYPQGKDEAGPHFWHVLHTATTQLPDKLSGADKADFIEWLKQTINYFPCKIPCQDNARKYIKKNSPWKQIKTRKDAWNYLCTFHNSVRREQGKEEYNCEAMYNPNPDSNCPHCQYEVNRDVKGAMKTFKNASVKIIRELCKREGIPMPEIMWTPCPEAPETSCNIILKDSQTGRVLRKPTIYLNPNVVSLRQVVHEWVHLKNTMRGFHSNAQNEELVEEEAQRILNSEFPSDMAKLKYEDTITNKQMSVQKDSFSYGLQSMDDGSLDDRMSRNFPRYAEMIRKEKAKNTNSNTSVSVSTETDSDGGFLSIFDDLFKPFGEWLGLPKRSVNEAHMSSLLSNIGTTLMETHLSVWGNVVATTLAGLGLFVAGAALKNQLAKSDKQLMLLSSTFFLYHNLHMLANPSLQPFAMTDARLAGQALQEGDINTFFQTLIDDRYRVASIVVPVSRPSGDVARSAAEQLRAGAISNIQARQNIPIASPGGSTTISQQEAQRQAVLQQAGPGLSPAQQLARGYTPITGGAGGGGGPIPGPGAIGGGGLPIPGGAIGGGRIPGPTATAGPGPFGQGPYGRPPYTLGFGPGGIPLAGEQDYEANRQSFRRKIPRRSTRLGPSGQEEEDQLPQYPEEDPYLAALRESGGIDSSSFLPGGVNAMAGKSLNNIGTGYNSVPYDEE